MVQGYYTLDDAAKILGMSTEALSQMAQKREVRGFTDRGTWRFRTQDIDELARRKGIGSNPDLQLGEAAQPPTKKSDTPVRQPAGSDPNVFNFPLGADSDQVEIGQEIIADTPSGSRKVPSKGGSKAQGPKSPPPKPGSDSDVRLVADGSDVSFQVERNALRLQVGTSQEDAGQGGQRRPACAHGVGERQRRQDRARQQGQD